MVFSFDLTSESQQVCFEWSKVQELFYLAYNFFGP